MFGMHLPPQRSPTKILIYGLIPVSEGAQDRPGGAPEADATLFFLGEEQYLVIPTRIMRPS